jgi:hypothetical protein
MLSALLIVIFSVIGEIDNPAREHQIDWHFIRVTIGETVLFENSVNN